MVDLNAHEAGNGGKKPRDAYSLPSLLYSEKVASGRANVSDHGIVHGVEPLSLMAMPSGTWNKSTSGSVIFRLKMRLVVLPMSAV
jgi:hypothetical protein